MLNDAFEHEQKLVDFLLGRASEDERTALESRLFTDDELNDELLATTDDLIHSYLSGELSREDSVRFETEFLAAPRHRQRLAFVKQLVSTVDRVANEDVASSVRPFPIPARTRRWHPATAAAVVLLAVGGAALTLAVLRSHVPPDPVADPPAASAPAHEAPALPAAPPPAAPVAEAHNAPAPVDSRVALPSRSGATVDLALAPRAGMVRMALVVDTERPGFDAVIKDERGKSVWSARGIPPAEAGRPIVLNVPARVFASGRYALRIEGEALRDVNAPAPPLVFEYRLHIVRTVP
jgi:hypothetical protein